MLAFAGQVVGGEDGEEGDGNHDDRHHIGDRALARADETATAEGKAVVGFYHSHPDHPARPSEYDRTHVPPWSYYSHVIVAVEKGKPAAMTCWVLNEQTEQFDEQEIHHKEARPS